MAGMPIWQVREGHVDFRLFDTPLKYTPAYGPAISLDLVYQTWVPTDLGYFPDNISNPLFGTQWHCIWSSELQINEYVGGGNRTAWNYMGGRLIYEFNSDPLVSDPNYRDGSHVEIIENGSNVVIGGRVHRSDGQVLEFLQGYSATQFLLTSITDPDGHVLTFSYDGYDRLDQITAATGETASFVYGDLDGDSDPSNDRRVTQINAPGNRVANFAYSYISGAWRLTNITDTVGISSSFTYGSHTIYGSWTDYPVETLNTPYGTTRFQLLNAPTNKYGPTLLITEPNGGQHLYLQEDTFFGVYAPPIPSAFDNAVIPTGLPLGTLDTSREDRNTFYWGPIQLAAIGRLDVQNWTWTEFKLARIRHWLGYHDGWDNGHLHVSDTLAWEQLPSPDGTIEGQVTWYDYAGKDSGRLDLIGTGPMMPAVIARVLPDGTTWYQYFEHNSLGKPTLQVETYTKPDGSIGLRTNTFAYAGNGIDMTLHIGPENEQVSSNVFNVYHQVTANYDALNQETRYTYDATSHLLTSVTSKGGLTTTNIYFASGPAINRLDKTIDLQISRTNSYTWDAEGNVSSHTDERGLTTTNYWDGLQRLTGVKYPDGTTTSNIYTALDITATKDRLGYWSYAAYNGIRQKTVETNANGVVTGYSLCDCGSILSITNAWNTPAQMVTSFGYDNQGNRLYTYHPDATETKWFDSLGRVIVTGDAWGYRWFYYNNQGLLTVVSNAYGAEKVIVYDIDDHPLYVTDANGVTVTNTYDELHRLSTRTYPDGGVERFGYAARGLVAYTNQLDFVTRYVYDEAGRKIAETNANNEVLLYTNNAAGDLLSLTDGKNQTTRWGYDEYGRVTNKLDQASAEILRYQYDPNSRLTNRWSAAKGDTKYKYDPVGNLTNIDYAVSTDVKFAYDPLNRVTNMVDAAGTTKYTYAPGGQLYTEDGPFANDTVTNSYNNRLRVGLRLQQPTGVWTNGFGYDAARRLDSVTSPAGEFDYQYRDGLAGSLVQKLFLPNTSYITNAYDEVARMRFTKLNKSDHTTLDAALYGYNAGNQRVTITNAAGVWWTNRYDPIGQLTVVRATNAGGALVAAETKGYQYDAAWNLHYRTNNTAYLPAFSVDGKNQLTSAPGGNCSYDANGNLTNQAALTYGYDDENRLVQVVQLLPGPGFAPDPAPGAALRVDFKYDGLGRLRMRDEYHSEYDDTEWLWVFDARTTYVYDGWRVIQERNTSNEPAVSYTRGSDLSGTLEGAGGIGGLLARSHGYSSGNWSTHNYYHAGGNGNITYLVNASQALAASYRYDAYGNPLSQSGSLADANTYRFSSKMVDALTGLYYYGERWYAPNLQRWVNQDPILEAGGLNLYAYVGNRVPNRMDPFGLSFAAAVGDTADGTGDCPGTPKASDNCYKYACGSTGQGSDIPGYRGNKACQKPGDCDSVMTAVSADPGISDVPADGKCPDGTHKIAVLAGRSGPGGDYHFFRQTSDGSWCHKFKGTKPSKTDGNGNPIRDPKKDDVFDFPGGHDQPKSYKVCGFKCASDTGK